MAKFDFMSLIIKSDKPEEKEVTQDSNKTTTVSFLDDSTNGIFSSTTATKKTATKSSPSKYLNEIMEVYQRKFDALNKDGYDFNEFFEAMTDLSPKSPETFKMAFHFAKKVDKSITKEYLLQTADFYKTELTNLHEFNESEGNAKLGALSNGKKQEKVNLESEINELRNQVAALENRIVNKNNELQSIDSKYANQISEIESKLAANTAAKDAILNSIAEIKNGIETNIN